ncbi:DUF1599 domain-containing protein [Bacteroides phage PhiCrAssBcn10]|nr:DUF1599 domain-containing protein [Bacteroides phage PhiCrAssBcn9]WCF58108.1 DUF1599 domain-containing protein [Bacteroides phage PhiCrAssBcn10]WCF58241.1 DUF1064 domain-containing protein [Bacteroides phage PhiCrAssBcn11]WCF58344.1 DUF1599 domain-containing protein [Bacteroides phage PhiCrAssBcn12]
MGKREVIQQAIGDLTSLANFVQYKKITPEEICKELDSIRINLEVFEENDKTLSNTSAHQFKDIAKGMIETYVRKNHDYGNSFDKSLDKFGLVASVVRIGDKMNRIESLVQKKAMVQDESIRDTLLDMANYAIMTVMWMDNQNKCDICQS